MIYRECTAYDNGRIRIILPVFDECEYAAFRNCFYSSAADVMYAYGKKVVESCKCSFSCSYVEETPTNDDEAAITLVLSIRRRGERTIRRYVTHYWKGGKLLRKIIR